MRRILSIAVVFLLSYGCEFNTCSFFVDESWIEEAPKALVQFEAIEEELNKSPDFVEKFKIRNSLFLMDRDLEEYRQFTVPQICRWFENGGGYISIDESGIQVNYKNCSHGSSMAKATLYSRKKVGTYKPQVKIIDSVGLKDGWYAHVTTCIGCND